MFVEGECVACKSGDKCKYCDPEDTTLCLICESGFFMNEDGECSEYVPEEDDLEEENPFDQVDNDTPETPTEEQPESIQNLVLFINSILLMYLF